jgi:hypothetical protein
MGLTWSLPSRGDKHLRPRYPSFLRFLEPTCAKSSAEFLEEGCVLFRSQLIEAISRGTPVPFRHSAFGEACRNRGLSPRPRGKMVRRKSAAHHVDGDELDALDSLAERGEFELPVPIREKSDGIRLRFATSRRTAKLYRPAAHF